MKDRDDVIAIVFMMVLLTFVMFWMFLSMIYPSEEEKEAKTERELNKALESTKDVFIFEELKRGYAGGAGEYFIQAIIDSKDTELNTTKGFNDLYDDYTTIFKDRYSTFPDRELEGYGNYIKTVQEVIDDDYKGDCEDYAIFIYTLAKKKGLDVKLVTGFNPGKSGHVWTKVKQGNKWIEYDSTSNLRCKTCISDRYEDITYMWEHE